MEILRDECNRPIVKHPGRAFPGILLQGDTIYAHYRSLSRIRAMLTSNSLSEDRFAEALEELDEVLTDIDDLLKYYEREISSAGYELPYFRTKSNP